MPLLHSVEPYAIILTCKLTKHSGVWLLPHLPRGTFVSFLKYRATIALIMFLDQRFSCMNIHAVFKRIPGNDIIREQYLKNRHISMK